MARFDFHIVRAGFFYSVVSVKETGNSNVLHHCDLSLNTHPDLCNQPLTIITRDFSKTFELGSEPFFSARINENANNYVNLLTHFL